MSYLKNFVKFIFENLNFLVTSLIIVFFIRYFIIQPFFVVGASMEPNFESGDYLIVDELSYFFRQPKRGEVIIFHPPVKPGDYYIKRIIGLPGEEVMIKDGDIYLRNSNASKWDLLKGDYQVSGYTDGDLLKSLNQDEYFVLGDHRSASSDFRYFGAISKKAIIGRALFRGF
ncbi:MAG: signal peptidase I, partial [Candidatus Staskawiczbacteria bacterium]|nr:signal peptidase I [Candidatus Staskawiczbacteria bacterium]